MWISEGKPRGMEHNGFRNYKTAKDNFRKLLREKQEHFSQSKFTVIENNFDIDTSSIWKFLRRQKGVSDSMHSIHQNGTLHSSPDELRDLWHDYFSSLLNEQPEDAVRFDAEF